MPVELVPDDNTTPVPANEPDNTFQELAQALPETAEGFLMDVPAVAPQDDGGSLLDSTLTDSSVDDSEQREQRKGKRIKLSRKMQKSMDKLKSKTAKLPILWFHNQAKNRPEWELDDEEKELITDSIETVFEILDVEIQIEPLTWTLTSIWWVIAYPIMAFGFLFLTKKSLVMEGEQREQREQTK